MATETITLELDADAAQVFKSASASEREKLSAAVRLLGEGVHQN